MHPSCRSIRGALCALLVLGIAASARAEEPNLAAREHFRRGYALAERGDAEAATHEFEQAYAASPNPAVLYNLGQAYAAAGRSSEAIATLERYLKLSGSSVSEARVHQVEAVIAYHAQRVGSVAIEVEPPLAALTVDERPIGTGSLTVSLNMGAHEVQASAPGFEPAKLRIEVSPHGTNRVKLHLAPKAESAEFLIHCPVAGVNVFLDGVLRGQTPRFSGGAAARGSHRIRFERTGYLRDERAVELAPGKSPIVHCQLDIDPHDARHGRLAISHPENTRVFLDDAPFVGAPIPMGEHQLRVVGPGFADEVRRLVLQPREHQALTVVPLHDPRTQAAAHEGTQKAMRIGSYIAGGTGLAAGIAAVVIRLDNNNRYSAWQTKSRSSVSTLADNPNPAQSLEQLLAEENSVRRRDSWALGLAVFSCSALATSVVLFLSSRTPEDRLIVTAGAAPSLRYEHAF